MEQETEEQKLVQTSGFDKREFVLEELGVLVKTSTPREELEYRVRYDELGFELVWKRVKAGRIFFLLLLGLDVLMAYLWMQSMVSSQGFWEQLYWFLALSFFVGLSLWAYAHKKTDYLYVMGGVKNLELWADKPGVLQVTAFVESLHEAMRKFYRNRFNELDEHTPYDELITQLRWLLSIGAVTQEEFDAYLEGRRSEAVIGFRRGAG
jgi:hypothetical protein